MKLDLPGIMEKVKNTAHPTPECLHMFQRTTVFLLLCRPEDPYILFILKADREGYPWRNQMALPGGHVDQADGSSLNAAFRELKEEVNIDRENVEYFGSIGHFQTIRDKDIEAFLGIWNERGDLCFEKEEIARIVYIPVSVLYQTHMKNEFTSGFPGYEKLQYPFEDVVVWGATARIIQYLLNLILPCIHL